MSNEQVALGSSAACARMNRLVVACRDDARAMGRAASAVADPEPRKRLLEQSRQRRGFVEALSLEVTALGGTPAAYGSVIAFLGASVGALRDVVAGSHEGDAYAKCARASLHTEKEYARAAGVALPARARDLVASQSRGVTESSAELGRLRGQH
jgi:uncharacterized protein (TIGR02284 family)